MQVVTPERTTVTLLRPAIILTDQSFVLTVLVRATFALCIQRAPRISCEGFQQSHLI